MIPLSYAYFPSNILQSWGLAAKVDAIDWSDLLNNIYSPGFC